MTAAFVFCFIILTFKLYLFVYLFTAQQDKYNEESTACLQVVHVSSPQCWLKPKHNGR